MAEIGISLSGGGYRAAMFHLGTLSYLNHLKLSDGRPFLEIVNSISTISGGTITGLWYMMNFYKGNDIERSFQELYTILTDKDLPKEILNVFLNKNNKNPSLIKEATRIYDKLLFHGETFGEIMKVVQKKHIHHFSANGTDFSTGTAFRFLAMREIKNPPEGYRRDDVGNSTNQLPPEMAAQIKLSEILAVSSCFPGGFEPMHYPNDFSFSEKPENKDFIDKEPRYRLMDGGIVDNQGIEPLLITNEHLSFDDPNAKESPDHKSIDLLIISDVSSPFMNPDCEVSQNFYNRITLNGINVWITVAVIVLGALCFPTYYLAGDFVMGIMVTLVAIAIVFRIATFVASRLIYKKLKTLPLEYDWRNLRFLSVGKIKTLALSRLSSLLDLSQTIFMRPIRRMRYEQVFRDRGWFNRRITNNISELTSKGQWSWLHYHPEELKPTDEMVQNSNKASDMGTTLWFTEQDKMNEVPEALFTTGQYNICMNLLEYIMNLKKDDRNTNENHKLIMECEEQLRQDWEKFKENPYYLLHLGKR